MVKIALQPLNVTVFAASVAPKSRGGGFSVIKMNGKQGSPLLMFCQFTLTRGASSRGPSPLSHIFPSDRVPLKFERAKSTPGFGKGLFPHIMACSNLGLPLRGGTLGVFLREKAGEIHWSCIHRASPYLACLSIVGDSFHCGCPWEGL